MPIRIAVVSSNRVVTGRVIDLLRRDDAFHPFALSPADAARLLPGTAATMVVIDHACGDALELCAACADSGRAGAIVVNVPDTPEADVNALLAGARGIVYARETLEPVGRAVRHVLGGQVWGPRRVFAGAWRRLQQQNEARQAGEAALAARLSAREREVLRFAAFGLANKEVAQQLAISEATVKVHLSHIFQKLGVRGRGELAAAFHGIIRP